MFNSFKDKNDDATLKKLSNTGPKVANVVEELLWLRNEVASMEETIGFLNAALAAQKTSSLTDDIIDVIHKHGFYRYPMA